MKYKIGEKVAFYGYCRRNIGFISKIINENVYLIENSIDKFAAHEKQIRKLKPKKKAREFWIWESSDKRYVCWPVDERDAETYPNRIRVIEVLK